MNKEEFAKLLNGRDIECVLTDEENELAKQNGLIVVYGASDDLIEIEGAINDEGECYDGGEILIDSEGILPDQDQIEDDEMPEYFERNRKAKKIYALWCVKENYSWAYETRIPNAKFVIKDKNNDDDNFCQGMVFDISSLEDKSI